LYHCNITNIYFERIITAIQQKYQFKTKYKVGAMGNGLSKFDLVIFSTASWTT